MRGNPLKPLLDQTIEQVRHEQRSRPLASVQADIDAHPVGNLLGAIAAPGLSVIGEFKRHCPWRGSLAVDDAISARVQRWSEGGVAALAVWAHPAWGGSWADLAAARAASVLPLLARQLWVSPYQLYVARAHGADGVILAPQELDGRQMQEYRAIARDLGMAALLVATDERQLDQALAADADAIVLCNRDLRGSVHPQSARALLCDLPTGVCAIAEGGLCERAELDELERVGMDAAIIGAELMESRHPAQAAQQLAEPR